MADKPENKLPKVPPFVIPGASKHSGEEPAPQNAHVVHAPPPRNNNRNSSPPGMLSSLILVISVIILGVAMLSGAWFAYGILGPDPKSEEQTSEQTEESQEDVPPDTTNSENNTTEDADKQDNQMDILSKIIVVGLIYMVGWIVSLIGVRLMGNLILPYAIRAYTWVVLGGILVLQILIVSRLYRQEYQFSNYIRYLTLFGAGLIALVGLHIILEKHSLRPFGFIIFIASLGHLFSIAYHYIFEVEVVYEMVWGDIIFFLVTTLVSILMIVHLGLLNGARRLITRIVSPKDN